MKFKASPGISKIYNRKRVGEVAQGVDPEFKPQYHTHTYSCIVAFVEGMHKSKLYERC
jgi:hypothetical protein